MEWVAHKHTHNHARASMCATQCNRNSTKYTITRVPAAVPRISAQPFFSFTPVWQSVPFTWTEHPRTRLFLDTFIFVHTSHCGSRCRTTCLHKTCSSTCHHMSERLLFPCFVFFFFCLSCLHFLSHFYLFSVLNFNLHDVEYSEHKTQCAPGNEEHCAVAMCNPLTGYEPNQLDNQLDNFDFSETSAAIFQDESVDTDTEPSYSCDAEHNDELIGKSANFTTLHSGARRISEPETNLSLS